MLWPKLDGIDAVFPGLVPLGTGENGILEVVEGITREGDVFKSFEGTR